MYLWLSILLLYFKSDTLLNKNEEPVFEKHVMITQLLILDKRVYIYVKYLWTWERILVFCCERAFCKQHEVYVRSPLWLCLMNATFSSRAKHYTHIMPNITETVPRWGREREHTSTSESELCCGDFMTLSWRCLNYHVSNSCKSVLQKCVFLIQSRAVQTPDW